MEKKKLVAMVVALSLITTWPVSYGVTGAAYIPEKPDFDSEQPESKDPCKKKVKR